MHRSLDGRSISERVSHHAHVNEGQIAVPVILEQWQKYARHGAVIQAAVFSVVSHSHYDEPTATHLNPLPHRFLARPIAGDKSLIDNGDQLGFRRVAHREISPVDEWRSHGPE